MTAAIDPDVLVVIVAAVVFTYVLLVRTPIGSETFVTPVVVAVTRNMFHLSTAEPVADVFCVLMSIDQMPAAYVPGAEPSNIQPTDAGLMVGTRVVAFAAVPGMYGHVASAVPFATPVPMVAADPCVSDICATLVFALTTVDAADVRKIVWTATG